MSSAYVLLEDGTRFDGEACGAPGHAVGEVVFTTGMSGYQECMTDPSFHAQLITFTAPMVGNYGVSAAAMESDRIHARAAIMREAVNAEDAPSAERGWLDWLLDCGVPGITGVDTRALVRHIREAGAMLGGVFPGAMGEDEARALIAAEPPMTGRDLAREVTIAEPQVVHGDGSGPHLIALDTGIKTSIVRNFVARGATLELLPCTTPAEELLARARRRPVPRARPGRPGDARLPRRHDPPGDRADARVRHLPRPPAALPGGRAGDVQAARSAIAAATTRSRTCARAGSRSRRRTTASRCAARRASGCRPTSARPS